MLNNNMYIKPLFDRVIVSSIKGVNTTSKGVIIPVVIGHKHLWRNYRNSGISELKIGDNSASSYNLNGLEINKDVMAIIYDKNITGNE